MNCRRINRLTRVSPRQSNEVGPSWGTASLLLPALFVGLAFGCGENTTTSGSMSNGSNGHSNSSAMSSHDDSLFPGADAEVLDRLEEEFPFGPQASRTIDYRIDWKNSRGGPGVEMMEIQGDSLFVLDQFNILTRLNRETGELYWRAAVEAENTEVVSLNFVPAMNRVYVAVGATMVVLEADTGSLIDRQNLSKIINVQGTIAGPYLVYGSRDGDLIWHRYDIGHPWRSYNIGQSIQVPPLLTENLAVTVGNGGELFVLDLGSAQQLWRRRLDDPVDAQPEVGAGVVYVAGRDQFVRAFDLGDGRQYWNFITSSELISSPTLIGDRVYQDVPGTGVVALEALPIDKIGGVEVWTVSNATGRVITKYDGNLLTWDPHGRSMSVIDDSAGMLVTTLPLPDVKFLKCTSRERGVFYVASDDGRIMRLSPAH